MIGGTEVLPGDQHHRATGDLTHTANNRESAIFIFEVFKEKLLVILFLHHFLEQLCLQQGDMHG